ncbi:MAG: UDP-N-acetylglucosamine 2-epimerase (non-hydrolyzing) [Candidatus Eremiobacter antarcticus]|nr:UDP-N-acetylglucosamine 2-epimerase (non-hydrolyzing) [Candidatus Eremiobacteraeota bacterium]MBC5808423.1 UDP-N-acetylglucosamine 2-epimerase (non-hydrolyzing) [Candidatus Eremiobacteraeota bacterium]PZR63781.1 MAG: UDP-N-acetylglucosamine 2-epimerase (non-hydrolyzing) [Candidatus Eremiobacter sp. RRmetagenome_bin22]
MKVVSIVGARPQFIKAAVLSAELAKSGIEECLIHTGQHYDDTMSQIFFDQLSLKKPNHLLGVGSGGHGVQTGEMMKRLDPVIQAERPDCVIVFGDTNTTLAGALVAVKQLIPLAHVEAGLRSFNRSMPEEINRVVTDHVASLHFAPTAAAARNLLAEGISQGVDVVGDVMVDLALRTAAQLGDAPPVLARLGLEGGRYAVATVHRASNTDDPRAFDRILSAFRRLTMPVVFPVHPRTSALARRFGAGEGDNVLLLEPLSYFDMIALIKHASVVLTDSGGMQKEAYVLEVPCVTLRDETEWNETLEGGWNALAGTDAAQIQRLAERARPSQAQGSPFGDGFAARRMATLLLRSASTAASQDPADVSQLGFAVASAGP